MPQINVTVPVYKVEPYLRRSVDSILAQSFTDFELILVDDGSPDRCGTICDEYIEKDKRVHVIHQPNGGLSAARNSGIDWAFACSDSEWLSFVDSDDWVHPQFLQYLYQAVKENNVQISVCEYEETDSPCPADSFRAVCSFVVDGIHFFASDKNIVATVAWNKLYRKALFSDIRYPVGKIHEDEFTTYKLLDCSGSIAYIDEKLYYYFINYQGITKKDYSLKRIDFIDAMEQQCLFFKKNGKHEYYKKWSTDLVLYRYPSHMRSLKEIGETRAAKRLRNHARMFILQNLETIKILNTGYKEYLLFEYFPNLNRLVMPICNFIRMISSAGLQKAVQYYKHKLKIDKL